MQDLIAYISIYAPLFVNKNKQNNFCKQKYVIIRESNICQKENYSEIHSCLSFLFKGEQFPIIILNLNLD